MNEQIRKFAFESAGGLLRFDERGFMLYEDEVEKFAELIRADEREACAKVCDGISEWYETRTDLNQTQKQVGQLAAEVCGVRIRERGEK